MKRFIVLAAVILTALTAAGVARASGWVQGQCLNRYGTYSVPCSSTSYYQYTGSYYASLGSGSGYYNDKFFPYSFCGTVFASKNGVTKSVSVCPGGFWTIRFDVA